MSDWATFHGSANEVSVGYKLTAAGIQLEAKEDIIQRLGRSPDAADAVVLCNWWRGGPLSPHAFSGQAMMSFGRK